MPGHPLSINYYTEALRELIADEEEHRRILATLAAGVRAMDYDQRMILKDVPDELGLTLIKIENEY